MKNFLRKNAVWHSIMSVLVLAIFVYFAYASGALTAKKELVHLGDGVYKEIIRYTDDAGEVYTGTFDEYGKWHGEITIVEIVKNEVIRKEVVTMVNGVRHGQSKYSSVGYPDEVYCYNMGVRIDCKKAATLLSDEKSGFEILSDKYPWYTNKLNAFGFDDAYLMAFMDTVEMVLGTYEFEEEEFDDYYQDVIDIIDNTKYDSLIVLTDELLIFYGLDLLDDAEFRRAVIDRYRSGSISTFEMIKTTYRNYLATINEYGVNNNDFEYFCHVFDSLMNTYGAVDLEDPYLLDSLDNRMYRAVDFIGSEGESLVTKSIILKSAVAAQTNRGLKKLLEWVNPVLKQSQSGSTPPEVAAIVAGLIIIKFSEADLIRNAVYEAHLMKKGIYRLPIVLTELPLKNSETSVVINGNVIEDGGANVTARGIVWGTGFNPLQTDNTVLSGTGSGSFGTVISGLNENETYFARSFATNSAGTAYGNCITFTTNLAVGIATLDLNEMDFKVFPNPTSGITTFSFQSDSPENIVLTIVNLNGQVVMQKNLSNLMQGENRVELNLASLENGIYNARLSINGGIQINHKFLVAH